LQHLFPRPADHTRRVLPPSHGSYFIYNGLDWVLFIFVCSPVDTIVFVFVWPLTALNASMPFIYYIHYKLSRCTHRHLLYVFKAIRRYTYIIYMYIKFSLRYTIIAIKTQKCMQLLLIYYSICCTEKWLKYEVHFPITIKYALQDYNAKHIWLNYWNLKICWMLMLCLSLVSVTNFPLFV